jgi:hypothetical protein
VVVVAAALAAAAAAVNPSHPLLLLPSLSVLTHRQGMVVTCQILPQNRHQHQHP